MSISTTRPARAVLSPLPRIYVYDHCPFCVRVRLAFGLKNIKHEIRFLANDDIPTPTSLIGKKAVPIFEIPPSSTASDHGMERLVMPESLDIIKYVDSLDKFGPTGYFKVRFPYAIRSLESLCGSIDEFHEYYTNHSKYALVSQRYHLWSNLQ